MDVLAFDDFEALLHSARAGIADLVVNNVTITEARSETLGFTVPLTFAGQWVLGREGHEPGVGVDGETAAITLGLPEGTAYFDAVAGIESSAPIDVRTLPAAMPPDQVATALLDGAFDWTIMDSVSARAVQRSVPGLARVMELDEVPLAWVLRKDAEQLRMALNRFLAESHIARHRLVEERRDLPAIREAGVLRMLTVTGPHTYFLHRGVLAGFEYELLQRFADEQELLLEVLLAADRNELKALLEAGRGDLISAALTITEARRDDGYHFTEPYLYIDELVVTGDAGAPIETIDGLRGRELVVSPQSSHWQRLRNLNLGFDLRTVNATTEEILEGVRAGTFDATLADSHLLAVEQAYEPGLHGGFKFTAGAGLGWVVLPEHTALTEALNAFVKREYRKLPYNLLRAKYFGNERRIRRREALRIDGERLSPYDDVIQRYSQAHDFDWRLVVAQSFQESEFKPDRTSFAGARGLMQVMPRTARQLGVDPDLLYEPEHGVRAGVKYLAWTRERFEASLPISERLWFALAAYNAGPGHVRDARKLARHAGFNGDLWFDNVERAMLLLAKPEYASRAAHGFVRGSEPVKYVRDIRERYQAYIDHFRTQRSNDVEIVEAPR